MNDQRNLRNLLKKLSQVTPDAQAVDRALAVTRAVVIETSECQNDYWRVTMYGMKKGVVPAAIVVAGLIALSIVFSSPSVNVAYADVVGEIDKAKTVQYLETRTSYSPQRKLHGPTEVIKVTILGRSRERKEIVSVTKGDPLPDGAVWSMPKVGLVSISDCAHGKYVSLDTNSKTFGVIQGFVSISPDNGSISTSKPAPAPEVDFYKRIREFPADQAKRLPPKEVDGKEAVGFRTVETTKRKQGLDTWTRTYWIDPDSSLPTRIEVDFASTAPNRGHTKWVLSNIVFDNPIDESLLSTDPPEGYKVVKGESGE